MKRHWGYFPNYKYQFLFPQKLCFHYLLKLVFLLRYFYTVSAVYSLLLKFQKTHLEMEERALDRTRIKQERELKKRREEEERMEKLLAEEEEMRRVEEEQKKQRLEEHRQKKRLEKQVSSAPVSEELVNILAE